MCCQVTSIFGTFCLKIYLNTIRFVFSSAAKKPQTGVSDPFRCAAGSAAEPPADGAGSVELSGCGLPHSHLLYRFAARVLGDGGAENSKERCAALDGTFPLRLAVSAAGVPAGQQDLLCAAVPPVPVYHGAPLSGAVRSVFLAALETPSAPAATGG